MGVVDFILRRSPAYRVRKDYDRTRERADRLPNIEKRIELLRMLDQLEPSVISVEEHHMSGFERKKAVEYIEAGMRKVKYLMDEEKHREKLQKKEER